MSRPPVDPVPAELRALFDAERVRSDMPADSSARILERLGSIGAAASTAASTTASTGSASAGSHAAGGLAKLLASVPMRILLATLATAGAVSVGSRIISRQSDQELPARASATVRSVEPRSIEFHGGEATRPATAPSAPSPRVAAPVTPFAPSPIADPTRNETVSAGEAGDRELRAESSLLESARAATEQGRFDAAIELLQRHQTEFARGRLTEERDSLWVQCLVAAGQFAAARTRAAAFRLGHPQSIFGPVVEAAERAIP